MPSIPALCKVCGNLFPSGYDFGNIQHLTLNSNSTTCPNCRSTVALVDGVFNIIGNTAEVLSAPETTYAELQKIETLIQQLRKQQIQSEEIVKAIEKEVPRVAPLIKNARLANVDISGLLTILLATAQTAMTAYSIILSMNQPLNKECLTEKILQRIDRGLEDIIPNPEIP